MQPVQMTPRRGAFLQQVRNFGLHRLRRTMQGTDTDEPAGGREEAREKIRTHLRRAMEHFEARLHIVRTVCSGGNGAGDERGSDANKIDTDDVKDEAKEDAKEGSFA